MKNDITGVVLESNRQTEKNIESLNNQKNVFEKIPTSVLEKLDNFARHVRRQALSKFLARSEIYKKIINVHGSVLDLGVSGGQSLFTWAHLSSIWEPINYTRKIIGFDTFEGIPDITQEDLQGPLPSLNLKKGGFAFTHKNFLEEAIDSFDQDRVLSHIQKIQIVQGDICQTLPKFFKENPHCIVSLLHIDVDTYRPTKVALETCLPRMPKGSVIVFDEINQEPYPGETLAVVDTIGISSLRIERLQWETGISFAVIE